MFTGLKDMFMLVQKIFETMHVFSMAYIFHGLFEAAS